MIRRQDQRGQPPANFSRLVDEPVQENEPWRVRIWAFGMFVVEVDGKPLEKRRKASHRLLELLAVIITFGGHDVSASRIIDALWPDADGDRGYANFKKSIARLRKLIGVDQVLQLRDRKASFNPGLCWLDVEEFDRCVRRRQVDQAIALYTGPFLGLEELPAWAEFRRSQLRIRWLRLVTCRCEDLLGQGNVEEVIVLLERAIEAETAAESLYQRLIPLLVAQGRLAEARQYYRMCVQAHRQSGCGLLSSETLRLGHDLGV